MERYYEKILIALSFALCLVGCRNSNIPEDEYKVCENILEVHNDYLSGDLSEKEAYNKLNRLSNLISNSEIHEVSMISIYTSSSKVALLQAFGGDVSTIKSNRDEIKKMLK